MQELDDIIEVLPEEENDEGLRSAPQEENDEYLRSSESMPKRQNSRTGIDRVVMYFDEKTYKSGKTLFTRYQ